MAVISKVQVDDVLYDFGAESGISYVESTDTENMNVLRDLESGTYVLYGRFKPFSASTSTLTFSSKLLVNIVRQSDASHVMVFYPVDNCVQHLKITDEASEKTIVNLNELMASVGDISSVLDAINGEVV